LISSNTIIQIERKISERLISSLRPFISNFGSQIRSGLGIREAIDKATGLFPEAGEFFELDPENFGLKSDLLFPKNNNIDRFIFKNRISTKSVSINDLTNEELHEVAAIILLLDQSNSKQDVIRRIPYEKLIHALFDADMFSEDFIETDWQFEPQEIGITRLQHSSFLLKTSKAGVIIDPHFVSGYSAHLADTSMMMPQNFRNVIDAVLITHSHTDHYHVPSLMMLPRDISIIVPRVQEETILSPNFGRELRSIGFQNVIELDWYSEPFIIGDIEISAMPFYGEQPLRYEHPRDQRLRNWGNSYFFRTPYYSAFCLIDSGSDADGSMIEVAESINKKFGNVDVVLSNLQKFYVGVGAGNPFYVTGNGLYWLSLTPDQIARFPEMSQDLLTLGPEGVAEICRITNAKMFLPYSHLWCEIGTAPPREASMLKVLSTASAMLESKTEIRNWRIGDFWTP
jgi:L-ascorbate metabolism protein UlaG (beta-lactamase superfamily)